MQQLTAEYMSMLIKQEHMKRLHLRTFEETIAQMYVALGKEVNEYRRKVISNTPLRVTTGSVTSFHKGHESLKSHLVSPTALSFKPPMCQSSQQETTTYANSERYPPDNVSVDSPEALDEVKTPQ